MSDIQDVAGEALERLERLAEVGQISGQERRLPSRAGGVGWGAVDVEHFVTLFEQIAHDCATDLAAPACDHDLHPLEV